MAKYERVWEEITLLKSVTKNWHYCLLNRFYFVLREYSSHLSYYIYFMVFINTFYYVFPFYLKKLIRASLDDFPLLAINTYSLQTRF